MNDAAPSSILAVLSTAPDAEVAQRIGTLLVEERLAACANVVDGVTSIFRWKGSIEREREALMVLKTTSDAVDQLRLRLVELHPYDVPEVLVVDIRGGHAPYLDWVRSSVGPDV